MELQKSFQVDKPVSIARHLMLPFFAKFHMAVGALKGGELKTAPFQNPIN